MAAFVGYADIATDIVVDHRPIVALRDRRTTGRDRAATDFPGAYRLRRPER